MAPRTASRPTTASSRTVGQTPLSREQRSALSAYRAHAEALARAEQAAQAAQQEIDRALAALNRTGLTLASVADLTGYRRGSRLTSAVERGKALLGEPQPALAPRMRDPAAGRLA